MKNLADISAAQLRRAADIREQVDKLAHELHQIFGMSNNDNPRGWSEERRAKFDRTIASRQQPAHQLRPLPKRRVMSAAARAKISAAARRRWADRKKMGHKSL